MTKRKYTNSVYTKNIWCLYMIRMPCGSIYTGITSNVDKRFKQHCDGTGAKCLRSKTPLVKVYSSPCVYDHKTVARIEYEIKHRRNKSFKEKLIIDQPADLFGYIYPSLAKEEVEKKLILIKEIEDQSNNNTVSDT
ncbi:hypothetical protein [Trichoplusia ni ascovirus 2c]|uniref:hypothetical protein n=1 Tax=Trichoplusia ni ascovirus 2c TaxID=328615 RepID=UPI0000E4422F|nr:hypothetical protein TNAV2c_gp087 [Trichoplusia ni ascovirus 2c]ABF70604.1 hypothetical protein [Trichoplusia ni ascovirus 2c]AUS94192.1 hypothetical protein [Trichoplusia ni ascovirus 6b]